MTDRSPVVDPGTIRRTLLDPGPRSEPGDQSAGNGSSSDECSRCGYCDDNRNLHCGLCCPLGFPF